MTGKFSLSQMHIILFHFSHSFNKHFLENLLYAEASLVNKHVKDIQEILLKEWMFSWLFHSPLHRASYVSHSFHPSSLRLYKFSILNQSSFKILGHYIPTLLNGKSINAYKYSSMPLSHVFTISHFNFWFSVCIAA